MRSLVALAGLLALSGAAPSVEAAAGPAPVPATCGDVDSVHRARREMCRLERDGWGVPPPESKGEFETTAEYRQRATRIQRDRDEQRERWLRQWRSPRTICAAVPLQPYDADFQIFRSAPIVLPGVKSSAAGGSAETGFARESGGVRFEGKNQRVLDLATLDRTDPRRRPASVFSLLVHVPRERARDWKAAHDGALQLRLEGSFGLDPRQCGTAGHLDFAISRTRLVAIDDGGTVRETLADWGFAADEPSARARTGGGARR